MDEHSTMADDPGKESAVESDGLSGDIIEAIKSVYDPEIPVNVFDLGLIYRVEVLDNKDVHIDMTLTAPGCPVAEEMPGWVQSAVNQVEGVGDVRVNMVFDPPWDPSRMSEAAKLELNML
jgi:FeS assembly SUF system protein